MGSKSGWKGESRRHSLARKGVKTVIDDKHRLAVNNYVARGEHELEYDEFSPSAKRGINKFSKLSSDEMVKLGEQFEKETGLRATNIYNKEEFYSWVDRKIVNKEKITIAILSGSDGKLYIEEVPMETIESENYGGNIDEWILDKYGSSVNWQQINPNEIHISKNGKFKFIKSLGKLKESKVQKGDIVEYDGDKYVVTESTFISHPEQLIGGERKKDGFYVQLIPLDPHGEEIGGWVNQSKIKPIVKPPQSYNKEIRYKGHLITKVFPSGYYEYYSDKEKRFIKSDDLDTIKMRIKKGE